MQRCPDLVFENRSRPGGLQVESKVVDLCLLYFVLFTTVFEIGAAFFKGKFENVAGTYVHTLYECSFVVSVQ
jgi:hypothetical protein